MFSHGGQLTSTLFRASIESIHTSFSLLHDMMSIRMRHVLWAIVNLLLVAYFPFSSLTRWTAGLLILLTAAEVWTPLRLFSAAMDTTLQTPWRAILRLNKSLSSNFAACMQIMIMVALCSMITVQAHTNISARDHKTSGSAIQWIAIALASEVMFSLVNTFFNAKRVELLNAPAQDAFQEMHIQADCGDNENARKARKALGWQKPFFSKYYEAKFGGSFVRDVREMGQIVGKLFTNVAHATRPVFMIALQMTQLPSQSPMMRLVVLAIYVGVGVLVVKLIVRNMQNNNQVLKKHLKNMDQQDAMLAAKYSTAISSGGVEHVRDQMRSVRHQQMQPAIRMSYARDKTVLNLEVLASTSTFFVLCLQLALMEDTLEGQGRETMRKCLMSILAATDIGRRVMWLYYGIKFVRRDLQQWHDKARAFVDRQRNYDEIRMDSMVHETPLLSTLMGSQKPSILSLSGENGAGKSLLLSGVRYHLLRQHTPFVDLPQNHVKNIEGMTATKFVDPDGDSPHGVFARHMLQKVDIDENKHISTMSGGQKASVAFLQALVEMRKFECGGIALLDEPFRNLSQENCRLFMKEMLSTAKRFNICVLLVSHQFDMGEDGTGIPHHRIHLHKPGQDPTFTPSDSERTLIPFNPQKFVPSTIDDRSDDVIVNVKFA